MGMDLTSEDRDELFKRVVNRLSTIPLSKFTNAEYYEACFKFVYESESIDVVIEKAMHSAYLLNEVEALILLLHLRSLVKNEKKFTIKRVDE